MTLVMPKDLRLGTMRRDYESLVVKPSWSEPTCVLEVIPEKPPKTVYSLTAFGESIIPVLDAMCQWGTAYMDGLDVQSPCCSAGA